MFDRVLSPIAAKSPSVSSAPVANSGSNPSRFLPKPTSMRVTLPSPISRSASDPPPREELPQPIEIHRRSESPARTRSTRLRIPVRKRRLRGEIERSGLVFIGPPAKVIRNGDKVAPAPPLIAVTCPSLRAPRARCRRCEAARARADSNRSTVIIKAAAGGGGRGMRTCVPPGFRHRVRTDSNEAGRAFGNPQVYVENW